MTDLIPKPRRRMKQPTKDALRQKIKDQAEELERLRGIAMDTRWLPIIIKRFTRLLRKIT